MYIKPFAVEEWMNEYEVGARFNIAETCVDSVSLDELFALAGADKAQFLTDFCAKRLTYGDIVGSDALRGGICKLYKTVQPRQVVPTHGAAGANHHVFCSLIAAGDRVVSIMPTYQQLYSIPEAIGADVAIMHLKQENDYLPDLEELRALVTPETKMICINNPNNPTGALMSETRGDRPQRRRLHPLRRGVSPPDPDRRVVPLHRRPVREGHLRQQHVQGILAGGAADGLDRHPGRGGAEGVPVPPGL